MGMQSADAWNQLARRQIDNSFSADGCLKDNADIFANRNILLGNIDADIGACGNVRSGQTGAFNSRG
jgi:hypothetical protein